MIFYIENIGYNWVIWDFGRSVEISQSNNNEIYDDFISLIEILLEDNKNTFFNELNELYYIIDKYKDDYLIIKNIFEKNNLFFSKEPIGKIITTVILK